MVLMSASDDLWQRTLARLSGGWSRLRYLAETKAGGEYRHWGLERVHGPAAARAALSAAHTAAWVETLRTPIRELAKEGGCAEEDHRSYAPLKLGGGSVRHFNSVAFALEALARSESRHRVA